MNTAQGNLTIVGANTGRMQAYWNGLLLTSVAEILS